MYKDEIEILDKMNFDSLFDDKLDLSIEKDENLSFLDFSFNNSGSFILLKDDDLKLIEELSFE